MCHHIENERTVNRPQWAASNLATRRNRLARWAIGPGPIATAIDGRVVGCVRRSGASRRVRLPTAPSAGEPLPVWVLVGNRLGRLGSGGLGVESLGRSSASAGGVPGCYVYLARIGNVAGQR